MGASTIAAASPYSGQVTFGGLPVPGATIAATQGAKKFTVTSDQAGQYRFDDLPDGQWAIEISLQCFVPIHADVTITPTAVPGKWELTLLPRQELAALARPQPADTPGLSRIQPATPTAPKPDATSAASAANSPVEVPKASDQADHDSSDGFLVNGSVNNAATSQFSLDQAFGNQRGKSTSLYNGGLAFAFDNSVLDARQYSLSGVETPKPAYNRMTGGIDVRRAPQDSALVRGAMARTCCWPTSGRAITRRKLTRHWCPPKRSGPANSPSARTAGHHPRSRDGASVSG